jgi:hypothetical protein
VKRATRSAFPARLGYWVEAVDLDGGAKYPANTPPSASYCSYYEAGTGFVKSNTSAFTFQAGLDLEKTFGISLSSQSGYSSEVTLSAKCGTHDYALASNSYQPGGAVADATDIGN